MQDGSSRYKEKTICLIVGKQVLDTLTAWTLWNEIDGIKQIMICEGSNSYTNEVLNSIHGSNMTKGQNVKDMMTAMNPHVPLMTVSIFMEMLQRKNIVRRY